MLGSNSPVPCLSDFDATHDVSLSFATFRWGGALTRAKVNRIAFRGVLRMLAHQDACSF